MGYSIHLNSNKKISKEEFDKICTNVPGHLDSKFPGGNPKQSWGYSLATDVKHWEDNTIVVSGSYSISWKVARDMVDYLKHKLEETGHRIEIDDSDF